MNKILGRIRLLKQYLLPTMLGLAILLTNGCWDRNELESLGLVQVLGLDLSPDRKKVIITTMIAIPIKITGSGQSGGGSGGSDSESGTLTITMEAPTIYEAFNRINTTINREITLIQNTVLIIGEDLAKSGVHKWIDTLVRFRQMRRTMLLFVCRGKPAEIMKVQPELEKNPSEYFSNLAQQTYRNGMFPIITIKDFLKSYETSAQENYAPILAPFKPVESGGGNQDQGGQGRERPSGQPEKKEPKGDSQSGKQPSQAVKAIRIIGTAIFKNTKMVGTFDIYESQILQLLSGQFREALFSISDPKKKEHLIAYRLEAAAPPRIKFQARKHGLPDKLRISLKVEADILSIQSNINYTTPKNEILLAGHIARELKKRIYKTVAKAQHKYKADVFGFGRTVRTTFLTNDDWNNYRWPERFPNTEISISVKVSIRRVGVQFQPPIWR